MKDKCYNLLKASLLALLLVSVYLPASVYAQVREMDLREIVGDAGKIFVGTVQKVWGAIDQNGDIVTYTTFKVEENVEGVSSKTITIKQLGGEYNGTNTRLAEIRYFTPGERVVLSMYKESNLHFTCPVGLHQGVWPVSKNNMVSGIQANQLAGIESVAKKYNVTRSTGSSSVSMKNFVGLLKELRSSYVPKGGSTK